MSKQDLPPFLMTSEPGSFARQTIVERKPQILRNVLADNFYPAEIVLAIEALRQEIATRPLQPLVESAPDAASWNAACSIYAGRNWLEVPWYFAETFFYRKLLEAVGYFQPGEAGGRDPFQIQKVRQIEGDIQRLAIEWEQISDLGPDVCFEMLLHSSLWGNRADLSNFTVKETERGGLAANRERHLILIDHTRQVRNLLADGVQRIDFICDNVGSDLLFDLGLADFLERQGWAQEIHLNLKDQPFFVSDAMPKDTQLTIELMKKATGEAMRAMGQRLAEDLTAGRLILESDPFWTTCLMFRQMPPHLHEELGSAALVLLKGDVNYRRLLDDRHWPHRTRMEEVCSYFPAPFVTLRTLKGEIMVGLQPGQSERLQAEDPDWLINGKHGVIQLVSEVGGSK